MIVTLTANPSIDHTVMLTSPLRRGEVLRARTTTSQPGGKGVNISGTAYAAGVPTRAVLPCPDLDPMIAELRATGLDVVAVGPSGRPRINTTVTEPDGTTTKLNGPGTAATPALLDALAARLVQEAEHASWVVLAGSLPPGTPAGWYAEVVSALRSTSARIAVDTSEAPLEALAAHLPAGAPDLLKPNAEELASITGSDSLDDPAAAASAARTLVDRGVAAVLATLGGNGAVLVSAEGTWHATPPPTEVVSTVGAGDSSLFGYLLADLRGLSAPERLGLAVAYGSAAAGLPGTTLPTPPQVRADLVSVRDLDPITGGL
ncbi:hexose kinase [Nocardioides sp.]|uniref:1-phosphofructokinase family hexose kinase n=1 Tax=Nocardioides sp. TaxID=35761 RepID=UPI0019836D94|nr:hexose kinase [Nocardioides sp.]MBC7275706.1 hexose kinase [Nocardioides sp.]